MNADADAGANAEADALRRHAGGARVLLVEDDPVSRDLVLELLHWAGLEADVAEDGAQAVAAAAARAHDLVLMDLRLPGIDGLEAAQRIRALPGRAALPIVALTARDTAADHAACEAAGLDERVRKPVKPSQLFQALRRRLPARAAQAPQTETTASPAGAADAPAAALPVPAIAGLNAALALRFLGGQPRLYRRVLEQFLHHYGPALTAARLERAAGDTTTLAALAHALWGSAETVGATTLAWRARALECARNDGTSAQTLDAAGQALLDELERLLAAIRAGLAHGETAADPVEGADTADAARLDELAALLRAGDYRAVALWRALGPALRRTHAARAAAIDARMRDFDFERAAALLEAVPGG